MPVSEDISLQTLLWRGRWRVEGRGWRGRGTRWCVCEEEEDLTVLPLESGEK